MKKSKMIISVLDMYDGIWDEGAVSMLGFSVQATFKQHWVLRRNSMRFLFEVFTLEGLQHFYLKFLPWKDYSNI